MNNAMHMLSKYHFKEKKQTRVIFKYTITLCLYNSTGPQMFAYYMAPDIPFQQKFYKTLLSTLTMQKVVNWSDTLRITPSNFENDH